MSTPPPLPAGRARPHSVLRTPGSCPRAAGSGGVRFADPDLSPIPFARLDGAALSARARARTASPMPTRGAAGYWEPGAREFGGLLAAGSRGVSPIAQRPGRWAELRGGGTGAYGATPPSSGKAGGRTGAGLSVALSGAGPVRPRARARRPILEERAGEPKPGGLRASPGAGARRLLCRGGRGNGMGLTKRKGERHSEGGTGWREDPVPAIA